MCAQTFKAAYEKNYEKTIEADGTVAGIEDDGSATVVGSETEQSTVEIPESVKDSEGTEHAVTKIDEGAFEDAVSLETIIIPATVQGIGERAFAGCTGLKSIYVYKDEPIDLPTEAAARTMAAQKSESSVFAGVDKTVCVLYVPYGCAAKYRAAAVWGEFQHIEEMAPTAIDSLRTNSSSADEWYDMKGRKLNGKPAQKGLYIQNGQKVVVK